MAQSHFSFSGTAIDTHDGTAGVIVSRVLHDSAPPAVLETSAIPQSNGVTTTERRLDAKRIRIEGAVVGTDKQDFEARLDALKRLVAPRSGQLAITNYGTTTVQLASFETGEGWSGGAAAFTNVREGVAARALTADTGSGPDTMEWEVALDLSAFATADLLTVEAHVSNPAHVTFLSVALETSSGNYYSASWTTLATGANTLTKAISAFGVTGSPSLATITKVSVTLSPASATPAVVAFDDLRITATSDTRTYDVTLSGDVQLPREHYHGTWCRFALEFLCPDGTARSDRTVSQVRTSATAQLDLPTTVAGSGAQALQLALDLSTQDELPGQVLVSDHLLDRFGYDTSELAERYVLAGSGASSSVAATDGYATSLVLTAASADATAAVRGPDVRDGVLTALVRGSGVSLFARADDATDPLTSSTPTYAPGTITTASTWLWVRLTCVGRLVRVETRDPAVDDWTVASETTTARPTGAWGIAAAPSTTIYCAHLELADLNAGADRTLATSGDARLIDTGAVVTDASRVTGTFPTFPAGARRASLHLASSRLGTSDVAFYEDVRDASDFQNFGATGTTIKVGLIFNSGANTHVRQRGTFLYLARSFGTATRGDVTVRLETTSSGKPSGTALTDVRGATASVVIPEGSIPGRIGSGTADYNASIIPLEVVWGADVALSASTDYAIVLQVGGGPFVASWYTPYFAGSSGNKLPLCTKTGAAAYVITSNYGLAILEGDTPVADPGTPWSTTIVHTPSFL